MSRILIIQTAFIGDVILATALVESMIVKDPDAQIDFLVRKGNEGLLKGHPHISNVLIWDKNSNKYKHMRQVIRQIRQTEYDLLINLQRFASTGFISWRSKAKQKVGFSKNPFSFCYDQKAEHSLGDGTHEIERNHELLRMVGDYALKHPKLYPDHIAFELAEKIKANQHLIVMAPSSVWFTKQLPKEKWLALIQQYPDETKIVLIGGKSDKPYLSELALESEHANLQNMAGELSLLESAALISMADLSHVNDSAPLHLATAMNAPVRAYFCSTVPNFGFGPLSDQSSIVEVEEELSCRPCGLHGKRSCPEGHFKCGHQIDVTIS